MLTDAQLLTLKSAIFAETHPDIVVARDPATRHDAAILAFYNAEASPAVLVWRDDVSQDDLVEGTVDNLAQYDTLTQGRRDAWAIFLRSPRLDFRKSKVRSAIGKCWAATQRDSILSSYCVRNARRIELVLGSPVDSTEGGVTAKRCNQFLGTVDIMDVSRAMNLA